MRADSVTPSPAIGSSSSSNCGLVASATAKLELALLAMAQPGYRHIGAMAQAHPLQRRLRRLAQAAFPAGVAPE